MSFGGDRPVIDGINSERIVSSKVCKCSVMSWDGTGDIVPLASHAMGVSSESSMGLGGGNL